MADSARSRTGKIARLPHEVREELCTRLFLGEPTEKILRWINDLPQAQEKMRQSFRGATITRANLKQWEEGGYQNWLAEVPDEIRTLKRIHNRTRSKTPEGER